MRKPNSEHYNYRKGGNFKIPSKQSSILEYDIIKCLTEPYETGYLNDLLASLPVRLAFIVRLRFAMCGGEPQTRQEIAKLLDVTSSHVRRLLYKASRMLRQPTRRQMALDNMNHRNDYMEREKQSRKEEEKELELKREKNAIIERKKQEKIEKNERKILKESIILKFKQHKEKNKNGKRKTTKI